jgi:molecular chaperone GrpE
MSATDHGHRGPRSDPASGGRRPAGAPTGERRAAGLPPEERSPAGAPPNAAPEGSREPEVDEHPPEGSPAPEVGEHPSEEDRDRLEKDFDELLAETQRERDEYLEIAQRARADFENYRKRAAREAQDAERRGKAMLARELVPALDNLERALRAAGVDPETGQWPSRRLTGEGDEADPATSGDPATGGGEARDASADDVARGVALVYRELREALGRAGVETYDPIGEKFDPATSEALSTRAGGDRVDAGIVLETVEKGYRLDGQVLRAARVVVSE